MREKTSQNENYSFIIKKINKFLLVSLFLDYFIAELNQKLMQLKNRIF